MYTYNTRTRKKKQQQQQKQSIKILVLTGRYFNFILRKKKERKEIRESKSGSDDDGAIRFFYLEDSSRLVCNVFAFFKK